MVVVGDLDPNRRQRQLQQVGEMGHMFVQLALQKKAENERRRQAELQRAYTMIADYPEIVDQPQGMALGEKFPELAPVVQAARNRSSALRKINRAGETWMERADRLARENQERIQRELVLAQPTTLFAPPNMKALRGAMEAANVHPDQFLQQSAEGLAPSERVAANIWAKERGLQAPEPHYTRRFDPMRDLPQSLRAVHQAEAGGLAPDTSRAARVGANIEEGAREELKRELDAARDRRARRSAEIAERGLDIRERRLDLEESGRGGKLYKSSRDFFGETHDAYLGALRDKQKAWDEELKRAEKEGATTRDRRAARNRIVETLGPRPEPPPKMMPGHKNALTRRVIDELSQGEDGSTRDVAVEEVEATIQAIMEWYGNLTTVKGLSPSDAVAVILGEKEEPRLPERDRR